MDVLRWAALTATVAVACGPGPMPTGLDDPSTLRGTWFTEGAVLTVTDSGAHFETSCAHGEMPGAIERNPFTILGTFGREVGPAVSDRPALYAGQVRGGVMALEVRDAETTDLLGSFTLMRGTPGRLVKCR
jgi:hypothetical protein